MREFKFKLGDKVTIKGAGQEYVVTRRMRTEGDGPVGAFLKESYGLSLADMCAMPGTVNVCDAEDLRAVPKFKVGDVVHWGTDAMQASRTENGRCYLRDAAVAEWITRDDVLRLAEPVTLAWAPDGPGDPRSLAVTNDSGRPISKGETFFVVYKGSR